MPEYRFKDKDGQEYKITRDTAPTQEELKNLIQKYKGEDVGFVEDFGYRTIVGGLRDAAQGTIGLADFFQSLDPVNITKSLGIAKAKAEQGDQEAGLVANFLDEAFKEKEASITLPKVPEPKSDVLKFVRVGGQYIMPYLGTRNLIGGLGKKGESWLTRSLKETAFASAVEQYAFNPDEARLSNILEEQFDQEWAGYLAADPNDNEAKARFKMALEGAGLGMLIDGAIKLAPKIKGQKKLGEDLEKSKPKEEDLPDIETTEPLTKRKVDLSGTYQNIKSVDEVQKDLAKITRKKDPLNFKTISDTEFSGRVGKNKFKVKQKEDGTYDVVLLDKLTKNEIDDAIIREKQAASFYQKTFTEAEEQAFKNQLTTQVIERPIKNVPGISQARSELIKRYVNKGGLPKSLNPKEPKIKKARNFLPKFHPDDIELQDIAESMQYDKMPIAFLSRSVRPGNAFERVNQALTEAGYRGARGENYSGMAALDKDEISDILYRDQIAPSDEMVYAEYLDTLNRSDAKLKKLEDAGLDPYTLTDEGVTQALRELDNMDNIAARELQIQNQEDLAKQYTDEAYLDFYGRQNVIKNDVKTNPDIPPDLKQNIEDFGPQGGNKPPVGGPEKAGNIRLDKFNEPDDFKQLLKDVAENNNDFKAARNITRFGKDDENLKELAKQTGLTPDKLLQRKLGQSFNAAEATAARMILDESLAVVVDLSRKARRGTKADQVTLMEAITRHAALQEQVAGITAEAGRALRAFQARIGPAGGDRFVDEYIKTAKTQEEIEGIAEALIAADSDEMLAKLVQEAYKPNALEKIQEAWINFLLSAPSTHAVNMLSNGLVATLTPLEHLTAAAFGKLSSKEADKISFGEAGFRFLGGIHGGLEGLRGMWRVLTKGEKLQEAFDLSDPLQKLELERQNAIGGVLGEVVRIPGKFLTLEDAYFKTIGQQQEYFARAMRQAKKEGKGIKRAYELLADKSKLGDEALEAAIQTGRYQTFTKPLGEGGRGIQNLIKRFPYLRFFAPFVRTPVNIIQFAFDRLPTNLFLKKNRELLLGKGPKREVDLARAKFAIGSSITGSVFYLAGNGLVTGRGPSDPKKRSQLMETGWQPYSIKVGDKYYSYNRFEPVGILFGVAADAADIYRYTEEQKLKPEDEKDYFTILSMAIASVTQNLINKTFLTGIAGAVEVISDPDRYGERFLQRFFGSFIPTISFYARKSADPIIRDAKNDLDALRNRIPGLSQDLAPRRNIFGEIKKYKPTPGVGGFTFVPINISEVENDIVFNELNRLDYIPPLPKREVRDVSLNSQQYSRLLELQQVLGTKRELENIISSPGYQAMGDYQKEQLVSNFIIARQQQARDILLVEYPELVQKAKEEIQKQLQIK